MKKLIHFFLFLFCSFLSHAQWVERNNGLEGGSVSCFATLGTAVFAGTAGGVFKSTDNGATWSASSNGITLPLVTTLAVIGNDVFAGTEFGIFRSSDNGLNWTEPNKEFAVGIRRMISMGDYLFVHTSGADGPPQQDKTFRSKDRGKTWTEIENFTNEIFFASIGDDLYIAYDVNVYRSSDKGDSWVKAAGEGVPQNGNFEYLISKGSVLFAIQSAYVNDATKALVYKSTDKGENWTLASTGLPQDNFNVLGLKDDNLFVAGNTGVYRSSNNGASWTAANTGLPSTKIYSLGATGSNLLLGTEKGIFSTANNGTSWASSNKSLAASAFAAIVQKGTDLFVASGGRFVEFEGQGVFISSDRGQTWSERNIGLTNTTVNALVAAGNDLFAGTEGGGVFYSANNGLNWVAVNNGLTNKAVTHLLSVGEKVYAVTDGGIYLSSNKGQSWTGLAFISTLVRFWSFEKVNEILFAGLQEYWGGVYRSTDGGTTWTKTGLEKTIYSFKAVGNNIFAAGDGGVYVSTDNGITWSPVAGKIPNLLPFDFFVYGLAAHDGNLFASSLSDFLVSTDLGNSWNSLNTGKTNLVTSLSVIENSLWASFYGRGLWERPLAELAPPATPVVTAASSINSTGFTANWAAASGATSYQLDISKDNFVTFVDGYNAKTVTGTSHAVSGLTSTTTYQYRVRAVNELGISGNSASISAITLIPTPTAPTALAATAISATGFTANWAAVSGATGYQLDISKDNFATFVEGYNPKTVATTSQSITGLPPVTAYQYRVRAVNDGGVSGNSASVSVTTNVVITGDLNSAATTTAVYPNPFADYIEIENKTGEITEIVLYDVTGRRNTLPFETQGETLRVNTNTIPSGVYLLSIQEGTSVKTTRLVKR
jgi:hypothetical protein